VWNVLDVLKGADIRDFAVVAQDGGELRKASGMNSDIAGLI
jgi:hypothetical protein